LKGNKHFFESPSSFFKLRSEQGVKPEAQAISREALDTSVENNGAGKPALNSLVQNDCLKTAI